MTPMTQRKQKPLRLYAHGARLTDRQVLRLRTLAATDYAAAVKAGVALGADRSTISRALRGETYRNVPGAIVRPTNGARRAG